MDKRDGERGGRTREGGYLPSAQAVMRHSWGVVMVMVLAGWALAAPPAPLALDSRNPHYFLFRGRPAVLVTSGEHYGSVLNEDFDYPTYLHELARNHLNLTRIWIGSYREVPGNFHIGSNTLAPAANRFLAPWARSPGTRAYDGQERFDLGRWNPAYFQRLRDFIKLASALDIVVEVNLFCPFYEDSMWQVSPLNAQNNVNQIGQVPRQEVLSLQHPELVAREGALVAKVVTELDAFDNVYYEICNEPYTPQVVDMAWQRHIAGTIVETEAKLPERHLISRNVANGSQAVTSPEPEVSILNFHYARPPSAVAVNYALNRAIGCNETGFDGQKDGTYRVQAWSFLVAGGALFNHLDYSFAVGHETGNYRYDATTPGGGSAELRQQLGILQQFFASLDLEQLQPFTRQVQVRPGNGDPGTISYEAIAEPGKAYFVYLYRVSAAGKHQEVDDRPAEAEVALNLPAGKYEVSWLNPRDGTFSRARRVRGDGQLRTLASPVWTEDTLLRVRRR